MGQIAIEKPMGVALVGAGMVAPTHVAAIRDAKDVAFLKGVLARSAGTVDALLQNFDWGRDAPTVFTEVGEITRDSSIEAVVVVTPPNARIALVEELANAGKHILLEKPIARSSAEASEIVNICEGAGVALGVVFQHRMRRASRLAKKLIEGGDLGSLGLVEIVVPWWREQSYYAEPGRGSYERDGGGVLISQAIHTLDLAISLTGPVESVQAMIATTKFHEMEAEDFATAGLTFTCGAVGSLVASTASFPGTAETITMHFEKASLKLDSGVLTVFWRDGRNEHFGEVAATGGGADPMAFTHEWHKDVFVDFVTAIRAARAPVASGEESLRVHKLIAAIERSARDGRTVEVEQ
ncbi:putative dehydrogenase [Shimia isoporae]|uniref:Putative dehydrogenase n=1 Tax=Shimia isoporae TaxID=647720 RepID=A0A4R1N312_9RHOB|nr:Gfo/Idh/MocA family oxidoreductase [Shimia isoporae]TCL00791.1 putative dehydrogenase [Shimia isoporae]